MSSEAAAYFPGALASRLGARESATCDTEVPLGLLDTVQSTEEAHPGPLRLLPRFPCFQTIRWWSRFGKGTKRGPGAESSGPDIRGRELPPKLATQKSFGYVLYTKDKSPIVFGFDLNRQPGVKRTSVFQA